MKILSATFISLLLIGCGNQEENSAKDKTLDSNVVSTVDIAPNPHDLILIDGEKWIIDEGMRVSIDSIELRMEAFNGVTLSDYEALSGDLAHHTKSVISNCTMKGQAHDELHKWLIPFIDLRKELIGITAVEDGVIIATELNNELNIFNTYFK